MDNGVRKQIDIEMDHARHGMTMNQSLSILCTL